MTKLSVLICKKASDSHNLGDCWFITLSNRLNQKATEIAGEKIEINIKQI